jgi:hypothetical protein
MIEKLQHQLTALSHKADCKRLERALLREPSPVCRAPSDPDLASVIRDYGPGSTPEQRALRVRLAENRRRLRGCDWSGSEAKQS